MPLVRLPDSAGKTLLVVEYGQKPYLGITSVSQTVQENVHNVDIRDDDVLICSYPKSGCHWLWEMARMLRAGTTSVDKAAKENYMLGYASHDQLLKLPPQRVLSTHAYYHQMPKKVQDGEVKIIFIYRNPKDVAVSYYNHHRKIRGYEYQGEFSDYLSGLFLTGKVDFEGIFTYIRDWEKVMDDRPDLPIFIVSYEELQIDTFGKAKELAKFLGSSADDSTIRDIVDKCSFGNMHQREVKRNHMYRKGKVGDWKNWFTVAQSEMMDQICETEMKGSRFQFQYSL